MDVNAELERYMDALQGLSINIFETILPDLTQLITSGADPNLKIRRNGKVYPLISLVLGNDYKNQTTDFVKLLSKYKLDISNIHKDDYLKTLPLLYVIDDPVFSQDYELIKTLLDHGGKARINEPDSNRTALSQAILKKDSRLVQLLLQSGANINTPEVLREFQNLRTTNPVFYQLLDNRLILTDTLLNANKTLFTSMRDDVKNLANRLAKVSKTNKTINIELQPVIQELKTIYDFLTKGNFNALEYSVLYKNYRKLENIANVLIALNVTAR